LNDEEMEEAGDRGVRKRDRGDRRLGNRKPDEEEVDETRKREGRMTQRSKGSGIGE